MEKVDESWWDSISHKLAQLQLGSEEASTEGNEGYYSYPSTLICNKIEDEIEQESSNSYSFAADSSAQCGNNRMRQFPYPINTRIAGDRIL